VLCNSAFDECSKDVKSTNLFIHVRNGKKNCAHLSAHSVQKSPVNIINKSTSCFFLFILAFGKSENLSFKYFQRKLIFNDEKI